MNYILGREKTDIPSEKIYLTVTFDNFDIYIRKEREGTQNILYANQDTY